MNAYGVFLIICMTAFIWLELYDIERVLKKILAKIGEPVEPEKILSEDVRYLPVSNTGYRWDFVTKAAVCSCCLAEKNAVVYLGEFNSEMYACPVCGTKFGIKPQGKEKV